MNNIGQRIKEQRIKKKITQEELSKKLYLSDKTISSYECGRTIPDINTLFKISNILDINLYDLIDSSFNNLDNLEIEIKLKVNKLEYYRIRNIIEKHNKQIITCEQIDNYYIPTYKDFKYEWMRIRCEDNKYIFTYKKKIIDNCCEEYKVLIDNFNNFETILNNLSFKKKGIITKKREKIMYNNKYEFSFDDVLNIGSFIEIEVKKIEKDNKNEIKDLIKLLDDLKIDINCIENKRYIDYLE